MAGTIVYIHSRGHLIWNSWTSYNQATTKLAFHSNETSKDKLSKNWLSVIFIQVHAKLHNHLFISTCS